MSSNPGIHLKTPVVVRSPNWLGDGVMALPALRNLARHLAPEPLAVATPAKLAPFWEAVPFVEEVIPLEQPRKLSATATTLRAEAFRSVLLLPNSLRSAAESALAGIRQIVGYRGHTRSLLLSNVVEPAPFNFQRQHHQYYYLDLVAAVGAGTDDSFPLLKLHPQPKPPSQPVLVLCPGAAYGPAKRWPAERFAAVANRLRDERGAAVALYGAGGDKPACDEVAALVPGCENRAGETSLEDLMAALATARVVLCNDSGAMHLATALGTPTVSLFGSTEPRRTAPLGPHATVLREHVPCSPCFLRECPLDFACMTRLETDAVAEATLKAWDAAASLRPD